MRAILLGRKPLAAAALQRLLRSGVEVVAVVAEDEEASQGDYWHPRLRESAISTGARVVSDEEVYASIDTTVRGSAPTCFGQPIDLVISVLFPRRIRQPLIALPRLGCFNFHPAPLPEFRGRRGYNHAILEGHTEYGASVHWVAQGFDTGDLVEVRRFAIEPGETALSLERKTTECLSDLFDGFLATVLSGRKIPASPQGPGLTATKAELLKLMRVLTSDDAVTVERKVRAFWYPPHSGASVEVNGVEYTLVSSEILRQLGELLHRQPRDRQ